METSPQHSGIKGSVDSATLTEIRSVLTALPRAEHFCDGTWAEELEDGTLARAVNREEWLIGAQAKSEVQLYLS